MSVRTLDFFKSFITFFFYLDPPISLSFCYRLPFVGLNNTSGCSLGWSLKLSVLDQHLFFEMR